MDKLQIYVPITKIDATKRLVYGTAASEVKDRSGERMHYETAKPQFQKWSGALSKATAGKSVGNVRAMHQAISAGKLTDIVFDDVNKAVPVCAEIVDDNEWSKVEKGVYTGFSIGGKYLKRWADEKDPTVKWYTPEVSEISLVDLPCNPEATFEYIKAEGAAPELRKFTPRAPTGEEIEARVQELMKDAIDKKPLQVLADQARKELVEKLEKSVTAVVLAKFEEEPEVPELEQVWKAKDGSTHVKKSDALKKNAELEAAAVATAAMKPVQEALDKLDERVAKAEGAEDLIKAVAAVNAVADLGSISGTAEDLFKVLKLPTTVTHVALVAAPGIRSEVLERLTKLTVPVPRTIEAFVAKVTVLPAAELVKVVDRTSFAKIYDPSGDPGCVDQVLAELDKIGLKKMFADRITPLVDVGTTRNALKKDASAYKKGYRAKRALIKRARELEAFDLLPAAWKIAKVEKSTDLKKSLYFCSSMLSLLAQVESMEESYEMYGTWTNKDLATRFGSALIALGDIAAEMLDDCLNAIKDEEASEVMELAAVATDLIKVGARHAKVDKERLQKAHDALVGMGASCGEAAKVADDTMVKLAANGDAIAKLVEGVTDRIAKIADRMTKIENEPGPAKGAKPGARIASLLAVNKSADDVTTTDDVETTDNEIIERLSKMDGDARNNLLMKAALRNGKQLAS